MFYSAQASASGTNATACGSVTTGNTSRGLTNTSGDSSGVLDNENLIENGGFETPVVDRYQLFKTGESFAGWKVIGAPGNVAPVSGQYTYGDFTFPAQEGQQFLDLTGLSNTATGVSQTVATEPGKTYALVGTIYNPGGMWGVSSTVIVKANGNFVCKATNSQRSGGRTQVWQQFVTPIKATSSETTISFINSDPPSDNLNGLDAVTLVPAAH